MPQSQGAHRQFADQGKGQDAEHIAQPLAAQPAPIRLTVADAVTRGFETSHRLAEARARILEGLEIALDNLDAVIKLIRGSADPQTAKDGMMKRFKMSDIWR